MEINRISDDTTWNNIGVLSGAASNGITFQIGADNTQTMTVSVKGVSVVAISLQTITHAGTNLTTAASMMVYISMVDKSISIISTNRGKYAAAINRLDHAIANMQNIATNLSTAKGRIEDADFALETARLTKAQIMSKAASSMLAQANASGEVFLRLIN